jgi:UDP-N-acetylmuramate--alanine ligase
MPLLEPVPVIPAAQVGPAHFIAVGGAGMSGIAHMFHDLGVATSGCDSNRSDTLDELAEAGIPVHVGHDPAHLDGVATVVVSTAIRADNPELVAGRQRGLRIWHRSAALASLMTDSRVVAVAGTHGKTTTSAMIVTTLAHAGRDPRYVVGAPLAHTGRSYHLGSGDVFVVEADESDGSFLQYPTQVAVITNIESDHLDNWGTHQHYAAGFKRFATQHDVRAVVINNDDPGARELAAELMTLPDGPVVLTYGLAEDSVYRLTGEEFTGMESRAILRHGERRFELRLQVPGEHNLANAAAAFAVGDYLGIEPDRLVAGAAEFEGTLRRFQLVAAQGSVRVFDDYAHHPTEVRAALNAARRVAGQNRLVAAFQPHLYSRTSQFAEDFGRALALADLVLVTDVYGAREDPVPGVSGQLIVDAASRAGAQASYVPQRSDLPEALAAVVRPGDVVMTLGAGDITVVGKLLGRLLDGRKDL